MQLFESAEAISLFCRLNIHVKKTLPIRSSEMGLLIYLTQKAGVPSPMAAANFFKVTKAMITNMVTSLHKKGYLEKQTSANDKRSVILLPTAKAEKLVAETYDEYFETLMMLQQKMGITDFNQLIRLLQQANEILLEVKENG